jgi:hypothetical protein
MVRRIRAAWRYAPFYARWRSFLISFEAWQDGFVFSYEGVGTLRHSSRQPAIFLGFPKRGGSDDLKDLAWKGLGACSLNRGEDGRTLIRFASPWNIVFEEVGGILRVLFLPAQASSGDKAPGFRLRFDAPGWDHVYGLGPSSIFDSAGLTIKIDPAAGEPGGRRAPVAFDRKGSWLAVSGGGKQSLEFSKNFTEIRCSSIPQELVLSVSASPAAGMKALTEYRRATEKERPFRPAEVGIEAGAGAASRLRTLLSLSFIGEGLLSVPIELPAEDSRVEEDRLRFALETAAFGPAFLPREAGPGSSRGPHRNSGPGSSPAAALFHRMSAVFDALSPYREHCVESWKLEGIPLWSHPGIRFPGEEGLWARDDQLMFGPEVLLAPTLESGSGPRSLQLPKEEWVHLWTSRRYGPGLVTVDAPTGLPAAFYRKDSYFAPLFDELRKMATRL